MKNSRWLLSVLTMVASVSVGASSTNIKSCFECATLKQVESEFRAQKNANERAYDQLQLRATAAIEKMASAQQSKLTPEQVKHIVAVFRLSLPVDPASAIVSNNLSVIKANRDLFDKEVAKVPARERKLLVQSIEIAVEAQERGPDPDAK